MNPGSSHRSRPQTGPPGTPSADTDRCDDTSSGQTPQLYTPAQAADLLAVPESWLRRQAGQRRIPSTRIGKHLRFSATDLGDIVAAGHRQPRRRGARPTR